MTRILQKKICLRYVTICYLFDWYDCICQCGNAVPSVFLYVCVCVCPCVRVCVCVFYQDKTEWQVFYIPGISTKFPVWIANGTLENRLTVDLSIIFRIILPDPCDTGVGLVFWYHHLQLSNHRLRRRLRELVKLLIHAATHALYVEQNTANYC